MMINFFCCFLLFYLLYFSCRRDSFITHRAFCDALEEESDKSMRGPTNPIINPHNNINASTNPPQYPLFSSSEINQQPSPLPSILMRPSECNNTSTIDAHNDDEISLKRKLQQQQAMWPDHQFSICHDQTFHLRHLPLPSTYQTSPHLSATALLQKAAEMGATMSRPTHTTSASSSSTTTTTTTTQHSLLLQEMLMMSSSPRVEWGNDLDKRLLGSQGIVTQGHIQHGCCSAGLSHDHCMRPSPEDSRQKKRYMNWSVMIQFLNIYIYFLVSFFQSLLFWDIYTSQREQAFVSTGQSFVGGFRASHCFHTMFISTKIFTSLEFISL